MKAFNFLWTYLILFFLLLLAGSFGLLHYQKEDVQYIHSHKEAKTFYSTLHKEGYDQVQRVKYIGGSPSMGVLPFKMTGIIDGVTYQSDTSDGYLSRTRDVYKMLGGNLCPDSFEARRSSEGWIYSLNEEAREGFDPDRVEFCIDMMISGIQEIKKVTDDHEASWQARKLE